VRKAHGGGHRRSPIRDIDLAESLGFDRPRDIRNIIARYRADLLKFGICANVAQINPGPGRPSIECWLNKQQTLFITAEPDDQGSTTSASNGVASTSPPYETNTPLVDAAG
jgi:hypothetical protein